MKQSYVCQQCSKPFEQYACVGPNKYCSRDCHRLNQASQRSRIFWEHIDRTDSCWLWTGYCPPGGYGRIGARPSITTHRLSWELHNGPIPAGLCVCHKCDVPRCVNPDHLFLGTNTDNLRDAANKGRTASGSRVAHHCRPDLLKLSADKVISIRELAAAGEQQKVLAARFGVHRSVISRVIARKRWGHI